MPALSNGFEFTGEAWLKVSFKMRDRTSWCQEGHLIAWNDFCLATEPATANPNQPSELQHVSSHGHLQLTSAGGRFEFDMVRGLLKCWDLQRKCVIPEKQLHPVTLWRAPTSNDEPYDAKVWRRFGLDQMKTSVRSITTSKTSESEPFKVVVEAWLSPPSLNWGYEATLTYSVFGTDGLTIHVKAKPKGLAPKTIPRFGIEIPISRKYSQARWFGLGPQESYCDKWEGARIGLWQQDADQMTTDYDVPQENGNRYRTRWARLVDPQDESGIDVRFDRTDAAEAGSEARFFDFALSKYSAAQLEKAAHPFELAENDYNILRIDAAHQGLGTGSCGPRVLEKYELKTQPFEFSVHLNPFQDAMGSQGFAAANVDTKHVGQSPFIP